MKNSRFAVKKLLVIFLAVVLIVVCISSSTFSWFDRPKTITGDSLSLAVPYGDTDPDSQLLSMKAYDGEQILMNTYVSMNDGVDFSTTPANPATSGTLGILPYSELDHTDPNAKSNRVYYKTEIINGSTSEQTVSLFIKNFHPDGNANTNVSVGVNVPVKVFKNYRLWNVVVPDPSKVSATGNIKRVYYKPYADLNSGYQATWGTRSSPKTYYVKSAKSDINAGVQSSKKMTRVTTDTSSPNYDIWYADIPADHNQMYFSVGSNPQSYQRTQNFENLKSDGLSGSQSILYKNINVTTGHNNIKAEWEWVDGACFKNYYSSVKIAYGEVPGQTINVGLSQNSDSAYRSISYSSSNNGVFTVSNSGLITPVAAGTANLTYTLTSQFGESVTETVTVTVKNYRADITIESAPIVTNLKIGPASVAGEKNTDNSNVQEVFWFIQNGDPTYGAATEDADYSLSNIYLSL